MLIAFSLALVSCENISGSNIDTKDTNLALDNYEKEKKPKENILSTDNEDISSILNKDKESNKSESPKKIDVENWKQKLVKIGEFDQEFVNGLAKDRIRDLVRKAQDLSDKTGYWDVKDFVFQELAKDFPDKSKKFPLDSIDPIYDWEISDDDDGVDKYKNERTYLVENGLDENTANNIANKDLKKSFKKAYEENEDGYYEDYIKAVVKMYKEGNTDNNQSDNNNDNNNNDNNADENVEPMFKTQAEYDQLKQDIINNYGFDPEVVKNIPNKDIDIANARANKRLEETGFGDIGLVYQELGKMYPGASDIYPGN